MSVVALPLNPGVEARALLHHLLEHGDIVGRDTRGRTIIQLAVDDRTLEQLMTFGAEAVDLENSDAEPGADDEQDGSAIAPLEVGQIRKQTRRNRREQCSALMGCPS